MTRRLAFLLPAGLSLLAGLDAALLLLGVAAPVTTDRLPDAHGFLLVLGFVGTVIALERAVALRWPGGFASPVLLGLGGVLLFSPAPIWIGQLSLTLGCAALVALYVPLWQRQRDDSVLVQLLGAVLATGGALLWLRGVPASDLIPWLAGFVVLTIAGERLELARVVVLDAAATGRLVAVSGGIVAGTVASLLWPVAGYPLTGLAYLALVAWLLVHDVATRTIRATGLTRFMAGCLLAGYAWLVVAALIWLVHGHVGDGPAYDAVVHAFFLGFTISMIMAHAPVILPAVLRARLPYHPVMIGPPALLHAALLLRLLVGDGWGVTVAAQVGGVLGVVALLGFVVVSVWAVVSASRRDRARAASRPQTSMVSS
jgi:hypothetical protein